MTCKSYKPLRTRNCIQWYAAVAALVFSVAVGASRSCAQQAQTPKEKPAYIRFWNMLPLVPTNNLLLVAGEETLFGSAPLDLYSDYCAVPVSSSNLIIKRLGEKQEPLQKVPLTLHDGSFITLLATDKGGQVNIQVVDDTPNPNATDVVASMVVRSFCSGSRVTVAVKGGQAPQTIPDNSVVVLDNLPMTAGLTVTVQATMPTMPSSTKSWDLLADFSVTHHATLLLVPDRDGRVKPRLVYNGYVANPGAPLERGRNRR